MLIHLSLNLVYKFLDACLVEVIRFFKIVLGVSYQHIGKGLLSHWKRWYTNNNLTGRLDCDVY